MPTRMNRLMRLGRSRWTLTGFSVLTAVVMIIALTLGTRSSLASETFTRPLPGRISSSPRKRPAVTSDASTSPSKRKTSRVAPIQPATFRYWRR